MADDVVKYVSINGVNHRVVKATVKRLGRKKTGYQLQKKQGRGWSTVWGSFKGSMKQMNQYIKNKRYNESH